MNRLYQSHAVCIRFEAEGARVPLLMARELLESFFDQDIVVVRPASDDAVDKMPRALLALVFQTRVVQRMLPTVMNGHPGLVKTRAAAKVRFAWPG